ncbi:MAG: lytic murein transglycosylase [Aestuariibacter sp.]
MPQRFSFISTILLFASVPLFAQETPAPLDAYERAVAELQGEKFTQCKSAFSLEARQKGVSESTITEALDGASLLEQVIKYDRNQPEFVRTFPDYLNKRVNQWRISQGKKLLKEHYPLLQELSAQYGIPPQYLVSFWGLETNFGAYKGKMPIIDALVTLACDTRRSDFFTKELIQALLLIDRENINYKEMLGSWAGAMGHTQFMPSAYMQYAVDGDEDGRADLWNSVPDALTSAANFLSNLGWVSGYRWGREIMLPENFDFQQTGRGISKTLSQWQDMGVTKADGSALGNVEIAASVIVPSGHKGPAFLVYDNFNVIMKWNYSEFYAIAVGHLADRIIGGGALQQPLPELPNYSIAEVKQMQSRLNELGFEVGEADGILGPATRKGIQGFQIANNLVADGFPYPQIFKAIQEAPLDI